MPEPEKTKVHQLQVIVRFDKPCSPTVALRLARAAMQAEYSPGELFDYAVGDPDTFRVTSIRRADASE